MPTDKHQLFNLERDPWELLNLFDAGRHDDVIRRLTQEIHKWQREVNAPVGDRSRTLKGKGGLQNEPIETSCVPSAVDRCGFACRHAATGAQGPAAGPGDCS